MTRSELYAALDAYLAALDAGDAAKVPWSAAPRFSENNVMLEPGDGLWGTISSRGDYELRFADEATGQVGFFGNTDERGEKALLALRLKVADGKIEEAETVLARPHDCGTFFLTPEVTAREEFLRPLGDGERTPRAKMIELAEGYFKTLQDNDGAIHTVFEPECERRENGMQSTHNPDAGLAWWAELGCEEQFALGIYRYNERVRRWHPMVDEERGLVLSTGFIDHTGRVKHYKLTNGREMDGFFKRPHSFYLLELFKIRSGAIESVEAVFTTVPYYMPTVWN